MPQTFQQVLATILADRKLSNPDRSHIERWASEGHHHDAIWSRLAAAASRGARTTAAVYEEIIREALYMRECAERAQSGIDFDFRQWQQHHVRCLDLTKKAEELAEYYKWAAQYKGIADFFSRFFKPIGELEEFHRKEAKVLRQRAGRPRKSSLRISRQDRSKGRTGLRKVNAFIDLADSFLRYWTSSPDHEAVAVLTNIAFPGYDLVADDVRKALRPTTREGRKQASRALAAKKS